MLPSDDADRIAIAVSRGDTAVLSDRERAIVAYAERLTRHPAAMGRDDIDDLRTAGLADREIHDLVQAIGYFAYANRVVLALGAELEQRGHWPAAD